MNLSWLIRVVSGKQKGLFSALVRFCLWAMTPIYRFAVWYRNRQFDSGARQVGSVDATVISIGNITTGGTGKTPMVVYVCEYLRSLNLRTAIVSRGYGAKDSQTPNDEAMELHARLPDVPHVQNPDRIAAAIETIVEHDAEVVVLDDGFQHRRINRDLDIVLIDASNPFGYGYLLPRGLLREPIASLRRADVVVVTRCESVEVKKIDELKHQIARLTSAPVALARTAADALVQKDGSRADISTLQSGNWFAFSAIGNPSVFEQSLEGLGCKLVGSDRFRDHHIFDANDYDQLSRQAAELGAEFLICTYKDLVKIDPQKVALPVYALQIGMEVFDGTGELEAAISNALQ